MSLSARRAWIEISYGALEGASEITSLSARRAWIEMLNGTIPQECKKSLSARRAWIEMIVIINLGLLLSVALRKESVDRNCRALMRSMAPAGRSPQGERG